MPCGSRAEASRVDILYLLVPLSAVLVLGIVGVFGWAVHSGQFDELDRQAEEIFATDTDPFDRHQSP